MEGNRPDTKLREQEARPVTVSNTGAQSFNYTSPTPCDANIRITVAGGDHSLELSAPRTPVACIQVLQPRSVDSNGTIVQNATWDLVFEVNGSRVPAQPGTYVITANFPMARFQTLLEVSLRIVLE